jgi:hypothetical protein
VTTNTPKPKRPRRRPYEALGERIWAELQAEKALENELRGFVPEPKRLVESLPFSLSEEEEWALYDTD